MKYFDLTSRFRKVGDSTRDKLLERAQRDDRFFRTIEFLDAAEMAEQRGSLYQAADGIYYRDTRQPFVVADQTQITGTSEALMMPASLTSLIANYFTVGKTVKLMIWGKLTTGTTAGNITLTARYGTTTGGTSIAASAATALAASKTNITCCAELWVTCRSTGATGSLIATGRFMTDGAGVIIATAANNPILFPASAPAATTVDTTTAQGIILDMTLSGAATCTWTSQLATFEALN